MRKQRYCLSSFLFPVVLFLVSCGGSPAVDEFSLTARYIIGDVHIESAAGNRNVSVGDSIKKGDTIVTGKKSQIDLVYGTRGLLRIQENSLMKVADLNEKTGGNTGLELNQGKLFVSISKLSRGSSFTVKASTTLAAVRGTSFRLSSDAGKSRIDVVSGKVNVNPVKEGKVVTEIERVVEDNQAVDLTVKAVQTAVVQKKEIPVVPIQPEVMIEIRNEIKDIAPEVSKQLAPDTVREIEQVKEPAAQDDKLNQKKAEEERQRQSALEQQRRERELADKRQKEENDRQERARQDQLAREQVERDRVARELAEKARKEKEAKDRASNVPTL